MADVPVLLIEGETFEGGRQNRVLNVSVLLGVGTTPIPVSCVEAHRWSDEGAMRLSDRRAPRRLRHAKNRSVQHSLRTDGSRYSDQSAVWDTVDATLSARGVASDTANLQHAYEALDATIRETEPHDGNNYLQRGGDADQLEPLPGQSGVVVAAGGRCITADLFDNAETLAAYSCQIVTSHTFDLPTKTAKPPSIDRALRFVHRIYRAEHAESASASGSEPSTTGRATESSPTDSSGTTHSCICRSSETDRSSARSRQWPGRGVSSKDFTGYSGYPWKIRRVVEG